MDQLLRLLLSLGLIAIKSPVNEKIYVSIMPDTKEELDTLRWIIKQSIPPHLTVFLSPCAYNGTPVEGVYCVHIVACPPEPEPDFYGDGIVRNGAGREYGAG